ncbi:MAG TPA: hypothetical protein VGH23_08055 [Rhizomicrobium sp.]
MSALASGHISLSVRARKKVGYRKSLVNTVWNNVARAITKNIPRGNSASKKACDKLP